MILVNYISVALSSMCIIVSLILYFCTLMDYDKNTRMNRLFRIFVLCILGIVSSDIIAWFLTGNTQPYGYYLIRITNFLHYIFGSLTLAAITYYMLSYLDTKINVPQIIKTSVLSLCAVSLLLTVISQFTGIYYFIDENNVYHRGDFFWISQTLPIIGMFINVFIVIRYRKVFERKFLIFFLAYMILPVTALFLAMVYYGITFINIATTFSALILYIGVQIEHSHNMRLHINAVDNHLKSLDEHYKGIQAYITESKRAEHDLRHHFKLIQMYNFSGEKEKLNEYLDKYTQSLPEITEYTFCDNFAVNSILQYYVNVAKSEDIQVSVNVNVPANTNITDSDLCIIFGNCIENAIEACRKLKDGKKLSIHSMIKGKLFSIVITNSFTGEIKKENDIFMSSKHEGEGIGISSVKAVVEKYGDSARFEVSGQEFKAAIILRIKQQ